MIRHFSECRFLLGVRQFFLCRLRRGICKRRIDLDERIRRLVKRNSCCPCASILPRLASSVQCVHFLYDEGGDFRHERDDDGIAELLVGARVGYGDLVIFGETLQTCAFARREATRILSFLSDENF